jgi:DNA-binding CsgD family transcriptional regulator
MVEALGTARFTALYAEGSAMSVAQAIACARRAMNVRAPSRRGWDGLTKSERSVAALAAAGLANPQIAHRLAVSRNAVKHHLTRAFAKLGISSRTHLAAAMPTYPRGNLTGKGAQVTDVLRP